MFRYGSIKPRNIPSEIRFLQKRSVRYDSVWFNIAPKHTIRHQEHNALHPTGFIETYIFSFHITRYDSKI